MLVNEWVETVWNVIQVRPKTLHDYKRLYRRHLMPVIGSMPVDNVDVCSTAETIVAATTERQALPDVGQDNLSRG